MAKLYVVGIGPGSEAAMTGDAKRAIEESEIIGGYTVICGGRQDVRDGLQR